jgi:hypothetical protein
MIPAMIAKAVMNCYEEEEECRKYGRERNRK